MTKLLKHITSALLALAIVPISFQNASAVDVDPGDYTALPAGTNLGLIYQQFVHRDELDTPAGTLKNGTTLDSMVTLFRYVHYVKIGPFTVDPQIIVPVGQLFDARVAGQTLGRAGGIGDIIPFATIWLINHPDPDHGTYLGFSPIVSMPTGQYHHDNAINLGNNRFSYDAQVGFIHNFSRKFVLDLIGDVVWYGSNNDYGAARQTLQQRKTAEFQAWGRYYLTPTTNVALGYAGYWGGRQTVDGIFNGTRTNNQTIRAAMQTMLTRTLQLEAIGWHDVSVRDGFRQQVGLQLRVAKIF